MYPRHRLDIGPGDLIYGLAACLTAHHPSRLEAAALRSGGISGHGLVAQSVRSGWHLLLTAMAWDPGSEVLVTAITHPDMIRVIEAHGLRVVPIDVDPATLAPSLDELARALTARSRALMVVDLFGGRLDLDPLADFARDHDLLLVDDAAQAFTGPASLAAGRADVTLFSFGMIKTSSAAGGAILVIRNPGLLARLRRLQRTWPVQSRLSYAGRLLKIAALLLLGQPTVYKLFFRACARLGLDPDLLINAVSRSAPKAGGAAQAGLLDQLSRRPSPALIALLGRRLRSFDGDRVRRRAALGERVAAAMPGSVCHPGSRSRGRTHWLFPVQVPDPVALVAELRRRGLDASHATSNLTAVAGSDGVLPQRAGRLMASVVYLPVYPELPEAAVRDLLGAVAWDDRSRVHGSGELDEGRRTV
jgi:perosamine synthetase